MILHQPLVRLILFVAATAGLAGCTSLRQGESTSRCPDCATALFRDSGSGGSIYNVASAGEAAVERVARRYCNERSLGQPAIGPRYKPPMGSDFWGYDFTCGAGGATAAAAAPVEPVLSPSKESVAPPAATAPVAAAPDQSRLQQKMQAIEAMRRALDSLPPPSGPGCGEPVTMLMRLPCGDAVSCTKVGDRISCN